LQNIEYETTTESANYFVCFSHLFGENYYFIHVENRAAIQLQKHYLLRQTTNNFVALYYQA
jgi:hypothetical protein